MPADATYNTKVQKQGDAMVVASGGTLEVASGGALNVLTGGVVTGKQVRHQARSAPVKLDSGAGTIFDRVLIKPSTAITIVAARVVYDDATTGTIAAATIRLGITVGGSEIVASTNLENAKAVGTSTPLTIVSGAVPANTPVIARFNTVAATQAGFGQVEIEYTIDA